MEVFVVVVVVVVIEGSLTNTLMQEMFYMIIHICTLSTAPLYSVKGVLHPWPIFWLFMHFFQKLQHIGDKSDMFLIGNIPRNLITALEFHKLKWLMIYGSKHGKILIFTHFLL